MIQTIQTAIGRSPCGGAARRYTNQAGYTVTVVGKDISIFNAEGDELCSDIPTLQEALDLLEYWDLRRV